MSVISSLFLTKNEDFDPAKRDLRAAWAEVVRVATFETAKMPKPMLKLRSGSKVSSTPRGGTSSEAGARSNRSWTRNGSCSS